ncbi:Phospholipase C nuclease [Venustampulla echinocandica]|uniref:Phospholipase C nuclease n=1 Tax=Venustampulla echinocandica TaxID=2656787 RepID=A0A370TA66_9HELO|nr:Phospholipase C nuclease [Venustampulla echinocandica]RDL30671.1 Phospholipase C nuclease [Venustampulla echinocandica]
MKMHISTFIVVSASFLPSVFCWGSLGHYTVAYIASNFVTNATQAKFQGILNDTSADYLASVATYADSYRYTDEGGYSKPFHYIDANDNPPASCGVDYSRDCGSEGCIVSAINNYTERVQSSTLSSADVTLAAKMLVHFIGDIHQPLHDENLAVGGNDIPVTFDGKPTNLHAVWDTSIPEKYAGKASLEGAQTWATTLSTAIKSGSYKSSAKSWLAGMDISDAVTSSMIWATDSNSYVCSSVMPNGSTETENVDLSGDYYAEALPIIQLQIAKAGYRLAAWLNLIATGSTCIQG